jgi:hypothetical protein
MNAAKVARLGHRWLGLIVGVQLLVWTASGLYMVAVKLEFIHGDSLVRNVSPLFRADAPRVSFAQLAASRPEGLESLRMRALPDGTLVYELGNRGSMELVEVSTGARISPLPRARVLELARAYYAGQGQVASARLLRNEAERPREIQTRELPLWRVDFDDWLETSLYVHPDTGALVVRRHRFWRWFDFLWSLHIMDYRDRTDVNNWLLRSATLLGLPLAIFGVWLAFFSFPFLQRRRARRKAP